MNLIETVLDTNETLATMRKWTTIYRAELRELDRVIGQHYVSSDIRASSAFVLSAWVCAEWLISEVQASTTALHKAGAEGIEERLSYLMNAVGALEKDELGLLSTNEASYLVGVNERNFAVLLTFSSFPELMEYLEERNYLGIVDRIAKYVRQVPSPELEDNWPLLRRKKEHDSKSDPVISCDDCPETECSNNRSLHASEGELWEEIATYADAAGMDINSLVLAVENDGSVRLQHYGKDGSYTVLSSCDSYGRLLCEIAKRNAQR